MVRYSTIVLDIYQPGNQKSTLKYIFATAWVVLVSALGYWPEQHEFFKIIGLYIPLFILYLTTYRLFRSHHDVLFFIFIAIGARAMLLFAFPNLSDDIFRFVWDGHLINDGINPFLHTPSEFLHTLDSEHTIYHLLYPQLNSPDYYSIYPPICQGIFALCAKVFPNSIYWSAVLMKLIFLIAETATIYFLLKLVQLMHIPHGRVLLYALNPLIIIEFAGNLHFEALMILFLVMAFWFYMRQRSKMFSISIALSIGVKLLPLMFIPFFVRRFRRQKLVWGATIIAVIMLLMFLPFASKDMLSHLLESLNLYFQTFEFNASLYYVARWLGYQLVGYNMIDIVGPLLSLIAMIIILCLAYFERPKKMQHLYRVLLLAFTTYLFFTTTIHPWYLGIPIMVSVLTHYRYPIFWSALIILTYINYSYIPYHENMWVVAFEYLIISGIILTEVFRIPIVKMAIQIGRYIAKKVGLPISGRSSS